MEGVDPRNTNCHLNVLSFDVLEQKDLMKTLSALFMLVLYEVITSQSVLVLTET